MQVTIAPAHSATPLQFNSLSLTNESSQTFSVTRLDFLLSDFALQRTDGAWLEQTNWQAFLSLAEKRSTFSVNDIPAGEYKRVRFHVGVRPDLNHSDTTKYPADHPLNPNLNGLHWGWSGGYIFFAVEGRWRGEAGKIGGFSYHLANDPMLMTVELPVPLNLDGDKAVNLALDLGKFFSHKFAENDSSTHSRKDDALATVLHGEVERAFSVVSISDTLKRGLQTKASPVLVGPNVHPYRFSFSATFPMPELPHDNPLTEEGVELGHRLFGEKMLSINGAQSCASCHRAESAFSDPGKRFNPGAEGKLGTRNAMPIFNLAWKRSFFWDGRAATVREQVLSPIQNPIEMHENLDRVVDNLKRDKNYATLFERAFGSPEISSDRIARALEQFVLTRISSDSKFDRALLNQEKLTEEEKRGFQLFVTEYDPRREQYGADCFHCHGGPLFQSQSFANNGLDAEFSDPGRFTVTGQEYDKGKFAVPSLRNISLTGPYMHDGRFKTLEEVVEHYTTGMKRSATLDPNLAKHPDGGVPLSAADKKALVAFLKTLTDAQYQSTLAAANKNP